jgi:hypothetical protein
VLAASRGGHQPSWALVQRILSQVPEVLDYDKEGTEPIRTSSQWPLRSRLTTMSASSRRTSKRLGEIMSLAGAAGYCGIPALPLRVFLKFEGIVDWS